MTTEKTEIVVTLDADGAVRGYERLAEAQDDVLGGADGLSEGFLGLAGKLATFGAAAVAGAAALGGIAVAGGVALASMASAGSEFNDVADAFQGLADKAGVVSDTLLNQLREATQGTATDLDLMARANQFMLAGLDPQALETVAKAARSYADATGKDATEAMDRLTQGILKGNDAYLKQAGLNIDNAKAFDEYAKSIGTTADKLSEIGKQEAIRKAALAELEKQTLSLGEAQKDIGDSIQSVSVAYENLKNKIFSAVANNKDLQKSFDDIAQAISDIDPQPFIDALNLAASAFKKLIELGGGLVTTLGNVGRAFGITAAETNSVIAQLEKANKAVGENSPLSYRKLADAHKATLDAIRSNPLGAALTADLEEIQKELDATAKTAFIVKPPIIELSQGTIVLGRKMSETAKEAVGLKDGLIKTGEGAKKTKSEFDELLDKIRDLTGANGVPDLENKFKSVFEKHKDSPKELADGLVAVAREAKNVGFSIAQIETSLSHADEAWKDFEKSAEDALEKARKDAEEFNKALAGTLTDGILGVIEGALSGDKTAIKDSLRNLGSDLGGQFGEAFGTSIGGPIGGIIGGKLGSALGDALGKGVFDAFDHVFGGGKDPENNARKKVDQFLASVFETNRLKLIIDGQLKDVFDLDFGGPDGFNAGSGAFDGLLAALPEVQGAFSGVGLAMNELLETGVDIGGQLAAVFFNNVGGSLNNLQILVGQLGFSFEQMSDAIVQSTLKGNISFLEAQTALIGIQKIAEKGIPDAFGDVTQAFKNLLDAGSKGGRVTVDALQDIAHEAKELGITTLPALQDKLTQSGQFTQEQITGLFAAMSENGIKSVEELMNASQEKIIAVLSTLQSKDILTEAQQQAQDLIAQINSIPSRKDVEINLKVNTTGDVDALKAASSNGGRSFESYRQ